MPKERIQFLHGLSCTPVPSSELDPVRLGQLSVPRLLLGSVRQMESRSIVGSRPPPRSLDVGLAGVVGDGLVDLVRRDDEPGQVDELAEQALGIAKVVGDAEAVEPALAAVGEDKSRMTAEAADVLYHLLVVLHARGITLDEVEAELSARTRQSGLDEKAARKGG